MPKLPRDRSKDVIQRKPTAQAVLRRAVIWFLVLVALPLLILGARKVLRGPSAADRTEDSVDAANELVVNTPPTSDANRPIEDVQTDHVSVRAAGSRSESMSRHWPMPIAELIRRPMGGRLRHSMKHQTSN